MPESEDQHQPTMEKVQQNPEPQENQEVSPRDQTGEKIGAQIENIFRDSAHPIQVFAYEGSNVTINIHQGEQVTSQAESLPPTRQASGETGQPEELDEKAVAKNISEEDASSEIEYAEGTLQRFQLRERATAESDTNWNNYSPTEKAKKIAQADGRGMTKFVKEFPDQAKLLIDKNSAVRLAYHKKNEADERARQRKTNKEKSNDIPRAEPDKTRLEEPSDKKSSVSGKEQPSENIEELYQQQEVGELITPTKNGDQGQSQTEESQQPAEPATNANSLDDTSQGESGDDEATQDETDGDEAAEATAPKLEAVTRDNFEQYRSEGRKVLVGGQEWNVIDISPAGEVVIQRRRSSEEMTELAKGGGTILPSTYHQTGLVKLDEFIKSAMWLPKEQAPLENGSAEQQNGPTTTPDNPARIPTEQEIVKRVDDELKETDDNFAKFLEGSKQRRLALEQRQRERNLSGTPPPDRDESAAKNDTLPPPAPTNGEGVPVPDDGELNPPPAPTQPESTSEGVTEDDSSREGVAPLDEKTQEELVQEKLQQKIERLSELMNKTDEELTDEERTERDTLLTSDLPQELGFKDATELQNTLEVAQNAGIDVDTVFRFRKELPEYITDPTSQEALDWFRQKKAEQEITEGAEEAEQKKTTERMRQEIKDAIASGDIKKLKQLTVDLGKMLYNAKYKKVPLTVKGITKFAAGSVLVFAGLYLLATLGLAKAMGGVKGGK